MRAAFYLVCDVLQLSVLQLSCDREDPLTEIVVTKIVGYSRCSVAAMLAGGSGFGFWLASLPGPPVGRRRAHGRGCGEGGGPR
jgi:hypothetical protein